MNEIITRLWKIFFEPVTKTIKDVSDDVTKTLTEFSFEKNKAMENLNNKLLEIINNRGNLASHLMSPLSKITNPENTSQFKIVIGSSSNRVNELLKHNTILITLQWQFVEFSWYR